MLKRLETILERLVVGESIPSLVRWGQSAPRGLIRRLQEDAFQDVVRYAASHQ